jgi:hypothetical protein
MNARLHSAFRCTVVCSSTAQVMTNLCHGAARPEHVDALAATQHRRVSDPFAAEAHIVQPGTLAMDAVTPSSIEQQPCHS